eukprot:SAG31_NODE_2389_length_5806_cov_3.020151_3_plen_159_part_00
MPGSAYFRVLLLCTFLCTFIQWSMSHDVSNVAAMQQGDKKPLLMILSSFIVPGKNITFRGIKNLDGVIDYMMSHGGDKATEFVVTGGSAGGLSTFLHADRFAAALKAGAKGIKTIRAAPVVGYFLDHDNFKHTGGGKPNTPDWSKPGSPTAQNYTMWM